MIVSPRDGDLVLVRQVDHQVQCGLMADAWGNAGFARPEPFGPIAEAARVHDEGWRAWEGRPEVGARGAPVDFPDIDRATHVSLYAEAIAAAIARDPRTGLLVSLHGQGLYEGRRGLDSRPAPPRADRPAAVRRFLDDQDRVQEELRGRIGPGPALDAWASAGYRLLQTWDVMSLHLTWRAQPAGRATVLPRVPRATGDAGVDVTVRPEGPLVATCDPWPFATGAVALPVPARTVPDRPFRDDADLRAALDAAPAVVLPFVLRPR